MPRKATPMRFEKTVDITVAWPDVDDLKVYQVTAIAPDKTIYQLDILSAVRPIKLKRKE